MKYEYTNTMGEISGFGGKYEDACRKMVIAGLEWLDNNKQANPDYKEYENIYGLLADENEDCKKLRKTMSSIVEGCTRGMIQVCLGHIMFIRKNGWDKYVEEMTEKEEE